MDRKTKQLALEYDKLKGEQDKLRQKGWGGYAEKDALSQRAREITKRMNEIIRLTGAKNLTEMSILVHRAQGLHHPLDRSRQIGPRVSSYNRTFLASPQGPNSRLAREEDVRSLSRKVASDLHRSMSLIATPAKHKGRTFFLRVSHSKAPEDVKEAADSLNRMVKDHMPLHLFDLKVASRHLGDGEWVTKVTLPKKLWVE